MGRARPPHPIFTVCDAGDAPIVSSISPAP